ncbi:MAG: hypothetical protein ACKVS6_00010 [Planctomycetota bacterium]
MEFVYVVRRQDLFTIEAVQGFRALTPHQLETGLLATIRSRGFFVERAHAERDSSLKQVIPYCMVVDETSIVNKANSTHATKGALRVLCLRRLGKQGEARLHDKLSIGIGGHLNPIDHRPALDPNKSGDKYKPGDATDLAARARIVECGVSREVSEELEIDEKAAEAARPLGVLNDDSTPVGSVHFGIVYALPAPANVMIREREHMAGEFKEWRQLAIDEHTGANFETWSSYLLRSLHEGHIREALTSAPNNNNINSIDSKAIEMAS